MKLTSYFKAFDKFYSWFPSFLDMFPDEVALSFFNIAKSKYRLIHLVTMTQLCTIIMIRNHHDDMCNLYILSSCHPQEAFLNFAFWFVILTIIGAFIAARLVVIGHINNHHHHHCYHHPHMFCHHQLLRPS